MVGTRWWECGFDAGGGPFVVGFGGGRRGRFGLIRGWRGSQGSQGPALEQRIVLCDIRLGLDLEGFIYVVAPGCWSSEGGWIGIYIAAR